jgi:hypothetical protein
MSKAGVAAGAGVLGLCVLSGLGKMYLELSRLQAASRRPRAPWEQQS